MNQFTKSMVIAIEDTSKHGFEVRTLVLKKRLGHSRTHSEHGYKDLGGTTLGKQGQPFSSVDTMQFNNAKDLQGKKQSVAPEQSIATSCHSINRPSRKCVVFKYRSHFEILYGTQEGAKFYKRFNHFKIKI